MAGSESLKLVAHRGGYDLLFSVSELVEIVAADTLQWETDDNSGLHACRFRGELLAMPDFTDFLGQPPAEGAMNSHLLVVAGEFAPFGVLIDGVCGIFAADRFRYRDLPPMLRVPGRQCYIRLALWKDKVLLCCDAAGLEACGR
ncbi:hypothetical protein [Geothermobacter hydrogeniphilus]|uniref:CheW-like domain-containing protein n=1 Tax=Geothermobacter hydrogeniphilus TaxID=1969733 RepID=A0A1X0Y5W5_9BACT|nr:hypothetical protein [Geothermobacter hydrogeniphilus]ORJ60526.1 hypothetical protein B5V00_08160 [Geothermobacter hydrogeniphilus]